MHCYWKNEEQERKQKFNKKWQSLDVCGKLQLHGMVKLRRLARKKGIKFYSKDKPTLIRELSLVTTEGDFPIK